ncbi:MAG TPA: response regulator [Chryseosolibacter sp.]
MKTTSIKTCLLVADDPDDHHVIAEAITKISENVVLLIVVDRDKAGKLLTSGVHVPDFLIVDLSMDGVDANEFLDSVRASLPRVPILTYGEPSEYADIINRQSLMFFAKEYEFSKLQSVLRDFIEYRLN